MPGEQSHARDTITVGLEAAQSVGERIQVESLFTMECHDAEGQLLWRKTTQDPVMDDGAQPRVSETT